MDNVFSIVDRKPRSHTPISAENGEINPVPGFSVDPTNYYYQRDIERGSRPFENYPTLDQETAELQNRKEILTHKYPMYEEYVEAEFDKILKDPSLTGEELTRMSEVLDKVDVAGTSTDDLPPSPGAIKLGNHAALHATSAESARLAPVVSLFNPKPRNQ